MTELQWQIPAPSTSSELTSQDPVLWFVLPVYNEGQAIIDLVHRIRETFAETMDRVQIVIVDDGSRDFACDELESLIPRIPITLNRNETNRGLGRTLKRGIEWTLARANDSDILVTMDGDNTHPPESVPEMVRRNLAGDDVVIASRFQPGATVEGLSANREWLSRLGRFLFIGLAPTKNVRDFTCGFRTMRISAVRRTAELWGERFMTETGFTVTADLLLKMRKADVTFSEVPLHLRYQNKTTASKMKVLRTTWQTLRLLISNWFAKPPR